MPLTDFVKSHQLATYFLISIATDLLVGQEQTGTHIRTHALTQRLVVKDNRLSLEKIVV